MKLTSRRTCEITITLDEQEAMILRTLLQNPVCDPSNEPDTFRRVRHQIFDELNEALGGYNPAG